MKDTNSTIEICNHCGGEIFREQTTMWLDGKTYHMECYYCISNRMDNVPMLFSRKEIREIVKEEIINVFRSLSS